MPFGCLRMPGDEGRQLEMHVGGAFTEVVSLLTPGRGLHMEAAVGWARAFSGAETLTPRLLRNSQKPRGAQASVASLGLSTQGAHTVVLNRCYVIVVNEGRGRRSPGAPFSGGDTGGG